MLGVPLILLFRWYDPGNRIDTIPGAAPHRIACAFFLFGAFPVHHEIFHLAASYMFFLILLACAA